MIIVSMVHFRVNCKTLQTFMQYTANSKKVKVFYRQVLTNQNQ